MTKQYTEKDISHFKRDTDKVRAKPNMYIGPNDEYGIYTILREVLDNGVDEARAGRNDIMRVWVHANGSFTVADNGVGIPVGKHKTAKISTLTHILTNLQSSGKMKGNAYKSSIGTHGVGLKATNALSDKLEVWTYRKDAGGWHYTSFAKGREVKKVSKGKPPKLQVRMGRTESPKRGTVMRFTPDKEMFTVKRKDGKLWFPIELLYTWAEMTSYMNARLTIEIHLETPKMKNGGWDVKKFYTKDGVKTYIAKRLEAMKATPFKKQQVEYHSDSMELALAFADSEGDNIEYFTNTVRNVDRGVHADDFNKAIYDALKPYMGKASFTPTDVRDGLIGVLNYKIDAPSFSSQTKDKLVDQRVKGACYKEAVDVLGKFFKENKTLAVEWCKRAAELRSKTNAFLADKKLIKNVKGASSRLVTKLAGISINSKIPVSERELFLVEGDSAGGTAKQARNSNFQATFATKGKPLNVMEATKDAINKNAEIAGLLAGMGLDLSKKSPLEHLKYGRFIYLTDPDVDGKHINCLFDTFFWKFAPALFKAGRIYTVKPPEYFVKVKDSYVYGSSVQSVRKKLDKIKAGKVEIKHIKGWGEVPVEVLEELAFQPKTRRLVRILPPKDKKGVKAFESLMGKDSAFRKKLLGVA